VLGRRDRVTAITITGRSGVADPRDLPSGAAQCGYTGFAFLSASSQIEVIR